MPTTAPTKAELAEYFTQKEERLALQRKADAIEAKEKKLLQRVFAHVAEKGGKSKSIPIGIYTLAIIQEKSRVAWQDEFVAAMGPDEAERLREAAPMKEKATITRAAA